MDHAVIFRAKTPMQNRRCHATQKPILFLRTSESLGDQAMKANRDAWYGIQGM